MKAIQLCFIALWRFLQTSNSFCVQRYWNFLEGSLAKLRIFAFTVLLHNAQFVGKFLFVCIAHSTKQNHPLSFSLQYQGENLICISHTKTRLISGFRDILRVESFSFRLFSPCHWVSYWSIYIFFINLTTHETELCGISLNDSMHSSYRESCLNSIVSESLNIEPTKNQHWLVTLNYTISFPSEFQRGIRIIFL